MNLLDCPKKEMLIASKWQFGRSHIFIV